MDSGRQHLCVYIRRDIAYITFEGSRQDLFFIYIQKDIAYILLNSVKYIYKVRESKLVRKEVYDNL